MVDDESLKVIGVLDLLVDGCLSLLQHLLPNCVVSTGKVVGSILLSVDEILGVEEVLGVSYADVIEDRGLEIQGDLAGDKVLDAFHLLEERLQLGVLGVEVSRWGSVVVHFMLLTVLLPDGVTELDSSLTNGDGNNLTNRHVVC